MGGELLRVGGPPPTGAGRRRSTPGSPRRGQRRRQECPRTWADQIAVRLLAGAQLAARADLAAEHARLDAKIKAVEASDDEDDEPDDDALSLAELKRLKSARTKARKDLKALDASLLAVASPNPRRHGHRPTLPLRPSVCSAAGSRSSWLTTSPPSSRSTLAWYDNLVNKYGTTLRDLEAERDAAAFRLEKHFEDWGMGDLLPGLCPAS